MFNSAYHTHTQCTLVTLSNSRLSMFFAQKIRVKIAQLCKEESLNLIASAEESKKMCRQKLNIFSYWIFYRVHILQFQPFYSSFFPPLVFRFAITSNLISLVSFLSSFCKIHVDLCVMSHIECCTTENFVSIFNCKYKYRRMVTAKKQKCFVYIASQFNIIFGRTTGWTT